MSSRCNAVLSIIESLPSLKELKVNSERATSVKKIAETVKQCCMLEKNKEKFGLFATRLTEIICSVFEDTGPDTEPSSLSKRKEKMWMSFSRARECELPALWGIFLKSIKCASALEEPLFMELVNETFLEKFIKSKYATPPTVNETVKPPSMTRDEENIIRYACGYVGMKLHDRFIKQHGSKAAEFVECIDTMHVTGPASSLLDYTREWVDKVNRGGLFYVSDNAYSLFVAIEITMQVSLTEHIHSSYKLSATESRAKKDSIIAAVMSSEDVLFHWYILAVDIQTEKDGMELLKHIVELWLTIRGFSISKSWMEEYKSYSHITTNGKKSLRKELKKADEQKSNL